MFQLATNEPLFLLATFCLTKEQIDEDHEDLISETLDNNNSFSTYLSERLPSDFGTENSRRLASFLHSMLQRDPGARKSTTDLLGDPFIRPLPDSESMMYSVWRMVVNMLTFEKHS
jgi:serine/threonine protein kinase